MGWVPLPWELLMPHKIQRNTLNQHTTHIHTKHVTTLWFPGVMLLPGSSHPAAMIKKQTIQGKLWTSDYFYPKEYRNSNPIPVGKLPWPWGSIFIWPVWVSYLRKQKKHFKNREREKTKTYERKEIQNAQISERLWQGESSFGSGSIPIPL